jgi:MFS family permease
MLLRCAGRRPRGPGSAPTAQEPFSGNRIVVISAVALAATAPGQTAAISAFIDPMIAGLGVSRSAISTSYLIGTLTGAAAMPWVGRALDRYGVRRTMAVIGAVFGAVLIALAAVTSLVGLTAGFVGVRLAGQGALGLTATTATALWFSRRRGTALGLVSAVGAAGISTAPILLERLVATVGWRAAWAVEGLLVWAVVIPLALLGMRDRPSDVGQHVDGVAPAEGQPAAEDWGVPRRAAMRTGFFWIVTASVAASGMLGTAVAFHQISLLGEQGLSPVEAAGNFLPQTLAALLATLATGALVDRTSPRWVTSTSMVLLAAGLLAGTAVSPGWSAIGFGVLIGAAGGSIRTLEAAAFPRYYGTAHIGSIRGFVVAVSIGSTAFGPLLFALVHDATGSYDPALLAGAALPALLAAVALFARPPALEPAPAPAHDDAAAAAPAPVRRR